MIPDGLIDQLRRITDQYLLAALILVIVVGAVLSQLSTFVAVAFLVFALVVLGFIFHLNRSKVSTKTLAPEKLGEISQIGSIAAVHVAGRLSMDTSRVRANLFATNEHGVLEIVPAACWNMNHPPEMDLKIPAGYGCCGRAASSGKPNVATGRRGWSANRLADKDMAKLHPNLAWIISTPVERRDGTIGHVFNVDGLEAKTMNEITPLVPEVVALAGLVKNRVWESE